MLANHNWRVENGSLVNEEVGVLTNIVVTFRHRIDRPGSPAAAPIQTKESLAGLSLGVIPKRSAGAATTSAGLFNTRIADSGKGSRLEIEVGN